MKKERSCIASDCLHFVCRECRTKVGWRHQRWCGLSGRTECSCEDCMYYREKSEKCVHPILIRKERAANEKIEYPV